MNPFEMVVAIVVVVMIGRVLRDRYRAQAIVQQQTPGPDALRLHEEVRQLRDRVQVLERVITDQHHSVGLDREIERLRDC